MNEREDLLGRRLARRLDFGLEHLDPQVLAKLRVAREAALEKLDPQPAWRLAAVGANASGISGFRHLNPRYVLSIVALVVALAGAVYWQQQPQNDDAAEIDAKLLSGDLPIDAYLDKGLDSWLKRTSH